jgi:hypothetical protein
MINFSYNLVRTYFEANPVQCCACIKLRNSWRPPRRRAL